MGDEVVLERVGQVDLLVLLVLVFHLDVAELVLQFGHTLVADHFETHHLEGHVFLLALHLSVLHEVLGSFFVAAHDVISFRLETVLFLVAD